MRKIFNFIKNILQWRCSCGGKIKFLKLDSNNEDNLYKCTKCNKIYRIEG